MQPEWFVKSDVTGRVKLIKDKKKLHRAMVLIQFTDKRQKSAKECSYHVFEALRDLRSEVDVADPGKGPWTRLLMFQNYNWMLLPARQFSQPRPKELRYRIVSL